VLGSRCGLAYTSRTTNLVVTAHSDHCSKARLMSTDQVLTSKDESDLTVTINELALWCDLRVAKRLSVCKPSPAEKRKPVPPDSAMVSGDQDRPQTCEFTMLVSLADAEGHPVEYRLNRAYAAMPSLSALTADGGSC
jgi:hypothetical protein